MAKKEKPETGRKFDPIGSSTYDAADRRVQALQAALEVEESSATRYSRNQAATDAANALLKAAGYNHNGSRDKRRKTVAG